MTTFGKAWRLLTPRERRRGLLVLAMVITMALLEMASLASIMPFLAVLGNPELVETNRVLASAHELLGFESVDRFLVALALVAFVVIITAGAFRSLTKFAIARFTEMRRHSLGSRLLETYLGKPYPFFLNRNSADLAKSILSEVDQIVWYVYGPAFRVLAYLVVSLAIIVLLLVMDPTLALTVATVLGGAYGLVFFVVKGVLGRIGRDRSAANRERFTTAGEALDAIKEIKLLRREHSYLARFDPASMRFARHQATATTLAEVPRYLIEALGFGGILALAVFLMLKDGDMGSTLPLLGLYAFAGYRLLPAAQQIYEAMSRMRFGAAAVDGVFDDLKDWERLGAMRAAIPALQPHRSIELQGVCFRYPGAAEAALRDIDLSIPVGATVGLVGGTGAGKTTLVDILLGLLRPTEGVLAVDGEPVSDETLLAWQGALGYVPQDPVLTDATVAENIALGVSAQEIDPAAVERAARMAQVHDFVTDQLPQQYQTVIGERGVRLSGGQRQRIAIARALYHDPAVLVLDEATSALDNLTEQAVMDAVNGLSHQKTIILIAHRLSTVRDCDKIVLLEQGRIRAQGNFADLAAGSEGFRAMAGAHGPHSAANGARQ
ncbi:ABC transporter ATP-binding protein [Thioalkalivibrio paradoxus ARh 1]|uniref:ABC transporter ATP-binding protein n=1 Tax=Thioalkalivibrio paradoxus ARh 1 TaxID=713585 RepID=W0DNH0_9GAMM|nr:ABC transporter ATP-binding protein [Thioalkalivibrio paradoxus ARh 1]